MRGNPRPSSSRRGLAGHRSARRGDYRALVRSIDGDHVVPVDHIDHHAPG